MATRPKDRNRPDDQWPPIFEFCVTGQPVSAQTKNAALLQRWKDAVSAAAAAAWPVNKKPLEGDVELRVTQYSERRIADRDNLIKPIQDALQSIAYLDDKQVKDSVSNWRNIDGKFTVRFMSPPLAMAFSNGKHFLHIRLWISPKTEELG